jgi:hydroxymethylpyrimidine/phosphomethylpyrimidine kinase
MDTTHSIKQYARVLTIAGSDSGGGAGIQADLKAFSAMGCYGMSVITALTAQNTREVRGILSVPAAFIRQQLEAVLEDIGVDAVKIGMLHQADIITTVAEVLKKYGVEKVVLDPVMVAKSGDRLIEEAAIEALKTHLLPMVQLLTPNIPEAEVLLGTKVRTVADMEHAARQLGALTRGGVLVKGGHFADAQSFDVLYLHATDRCLHFPFRKIDTPNTHGTGCTLSSALAACLAKGQDLATAVGTAQQYNQQAIAAGAAYQTGKGHGPVHHFHAWWA